MLESDSSDSDKAKSQSEVKKKRPAIDKSKRKLIKTKTCDDVGHHNPYAISQKASSSLGSAVEQIEKRMEIDGNMKRKSGILANYIKRNKIDDHCAEELKLSHTKSSTSKKILKSNKSSNHVCCGHGDKSEESKGESPNSPAKIEHS